MFILLNIIVIALVGLLAYWWANQGLFSALLHLLCVIVAGAITLAFWEPLTYGLLVRGSGFDDYALGVSFIVLFALSLFILRLVMDRLAPANVRLPHWANLGFGGVAGAAAGVITVGMLIMGCGMVQSNAKLLGWRGWSRDAGRGAEVREARALWLPFHKWTNEFYSWLSVTSMSSGQPLRHYSPSLFQQATLLRDSFEEGKGKMSLQPSAASIRGVYTLGDNTPPDGYLVEMHFGRTVRDFGEQLTVSSAQVRLIGVASGTAKAPVAFPRAWKQHDGYHLFDDVSHYAISEPGKETADITFEFPALPGFVPAFIQVRGTRYRLPATSQFKPAPQVLVSLRNRKLMKAEAVEVATGGSIQEAIRISNEIRPIQISLNTMPPSIKQVDKLLTSGQATFKKGGRRGSRVLAIQGIYEPEGTRCVRLDVSRGGIADIFRLASEVEEDATLALVDSRGSEYSPMGYWHDKGTGEITIRLEPTTFLRRMADLPRLPTSGTQTLELLFYITEEVTITGFRFGDIDVGNCNLMVKKRGS